MVYRVSFHRKAISDVERLHRWASESAPMQGPIWFRRLITATDSLRYLPHRCPDTALAKSGKRAIKKLLFGRRPHIYRILYTIRQEEVLILRVISAKRAQ